MPIYHPTATEPEILIRRHGNFSTERMDSLILPRQAFRREKLIDAVIMHHKAVWGGLIEAHFGSDTVDHVFEQ